jgi:hypothetical protein
MKPRTIGILVLLAVLALRIVPVPTGGFGQGILAGLTSQDKGFVLTAQRVLWRFPFGAVLDQARIDAGVVILAPRLEIRISPWQLLVGRMRITSIDAPRLSVRTSPTALGVLQTLDALDSVPLGRWFPRGLLPSRLGVERLEVRSLEGENLLAGRDVLVRHDGQILSITADSLRLLGVLAGKDFRAAGRLPLALDTFRLDLPGGALHGRAAIEAKALNAELSMRMDLGALALGIGAAKAGGKVSCERLRVVLPLSSKALKMDGVLTADSVWLRDFSYGQDAWARQFAPELSQVGLGRVEIRPTGLDGNKLQIASLKAEGDTLRLDAKGWVCLDGRVSLRAKVGMAKRYSLTRPGLLRAALQPGNDGFDHTSIHITGPMNALRLAPTSEAVADAASNPFRSLGELFR